MWNARVASTLVVVALAGAGTAWLVSSPRGAETPREKAGGKPSPASVGSGAAAAVRPAPVDEASQAAAALARARAAGKHLFVFCHRGGDQLAGTPATAFRAALAEAAGRADGIAVEIADAREKWFVDRHDLTRMPLPAVLVFAPNGAMVRGFVEFDAKQLLSAFASPAMALCLQAFEEKKLVALCVQNATTRSSEIALGAVRALAADARYAGKVEIVTVDPADAVEAALLAQFKVDPKTADAVTVLMNPPGTVVATIQGATSVDALVQALLPKPSS
jgi:hypothetical protein